MSVYPSISARAESSRVVHWILAMTSTASLQANESIISKRRDRGGGAAQQGGSGIPNVE